MKARMSVPSDETIDTFKAARSMRQSTLSIIVPAYNATQYLNDCLTALIEQIPPDGELLVVDDNSHDHSAQMAEKMGATVFRTDHNMGPSFARNLGARKANGELFFFVDADMVLKPGMVQNVLATFQQHPEIDAVFGSYDNCPQADGIVSQFRNLLHHYTHQRGETEAATFWAGCGAIKRDMFEKIGGFDEKAFPRCIEDIELGYRIKAAGGNILLDKSLQAKHLKRWTFWNMLKTDVFCRAIPWTRLERSRPTEHKTLNIRFSQKLSILLLALSLLAIIASFWYTSAGLATVLLLMVMILLNIDLYRFFYQQRGMAFSLAGGALHLLYFLYSGLSYVYVFVCIQLRLPLNDGNNKT